MVVQKSWWKGLQRCLSAVMVLGLVATSLPTVALAATPNIAEASTPPVIQALRRKLERYQPQVQILTPKPGETVQDTSIALKFAVKDLPIYKDAKLGLGPHLHVFLDEDNYQAVYDISQPLVLKDLKPGTHTIRVFASRPWHESFKNDGAFAQVSFNVFTATQDDRPNPDLPLLTYSRPQASYGAEPIMLDYYLTNAPLHLVADDDKTVRDWRVKATIDGTSFILDKWQPIYLKGLPTGQNWAQLEFVDAKGAAIPNVFNNTVKLFDYQPGGSDTLSKLVRGELSEAAAMGIVDPNYVPTVAPPTEAKPVAAPAIEAKPAVPPAVKPEVKPEVKPPTPTAKSGAIPMVSDRPKVIVPIPAPVAKPAAPTAPAKSGIAKPAAAAAAVGAAAAAKLIAPKIMPAVTATPKSTVVKSPAIKPEVKPVVKPPVIKTAPVKIPVVKPEVKPTITATPKVEAKPVAPKVEAKKVEARVAPKVEPKKVELKVAPKVESKKVEPKKVELKVAPKKVEVKVEAKQVEAPIAKSSSPFDGFLNRFKSNDGPAETVKSIAKPAAGAAAATKLIAPKIAPTPAVTPKPAAKPVVKAPDIKTPMVKPEVNVVKPVVKTPAPTQPAATKANDSKSPFGGFLNQFKSTATPTTPKPIAPKPAAVAPATKPATTVKPAVAPKTLTQPAIKPIEIKPVATSKPTAIAKPVVTTPTKPVVPAPPVAVKPTSDKFEYLKKYLEKPATAKSIVTKPAAQPIPGKAAKPQPANAIVPKSTTRRDNPAPAPKPAITPPAAKVVTPAKPIAKPVATKTPDSDKFLLNQLELPKDVRSLVDRLPMPKEKPDELVPIGKLLGK